MLLVSTGKYREVSGVCWDRGCCRDRGLFHTNNVEFPGCELKRRGLEDWGES